MKNLFEEFKEYESLWEDTEVPETDDSKVEIDVKDEEEELTIKEQKEKLRQELGLSSSVEEALDNFPYDFEIEYGGYTDTWEEDRWDPNSPSGHYTVTKSKYHEPRTVFVDPKDALEFVYESIVGGDDKYLTPAYLAKEVKRIKAGLLSWNKDRAPEIEEKANRFLSEYNKVRELYDNSYDAEDLLRTFIADNLDTFVYYYEPLFAEHFADEW